MPYCAVPGCTNGTSTTNKASSPIIKYHRLPANPDIAARWWQAVRRDADLHSVKDPRVCSVHFPPGSFTSTGRPHPDAIPCLGIPRNPPKNGDAAAGRGVRLQDRQRAAEAGGEALQPVSTPGPATCTRCVRLEEENARLRAELSLMRSLPQALPSCSTIFTAQQAQCLITGNRPRRWDEETILKAINIRVHGTRRQYSWMREELGLPLPGLSTLQKWLSELELRPDTWDKQMALLARLVAPLSERDRSCIVMMDEMDLSGLASYDIQADQVLGPYKHVQVFFAGGLFAPWKMPVLYSFDTAVQAGTLKDLIAAMELAGARVMATVSDMGGSNQGLWRRLQISHEGTTFFTNPADTSRRVWVLGDTPHIFKCLRNNILKDGVRTSRGGVINKQLMRDAVAVDGNSEFRLLHKVNLSTHVEISGTALQKVRPALQLLSATTASVIDRHLPGKAEEARVIRLMDAACDVLNAAHPRDLKSLRCGYSGTEQQEEALSAAMDECRLMRVGNNKYLYAFQKALLVTITSVRGLLADIRSTHGDQLYLLTRRANQDRLESFFSMVRSRGGSNLNPTPTEVKARLRLLTVLLVMRRGVNPLLAAPSVSTGDSEDDPELQDQLSDIEEETRCEEDAELDGDLQQYATPEAEDDLQAFLNTINEGAAAGPLPRPGPSSARDMETGVAASESAMAYVAGYVARKAPADGELIAAPEDGPVRNLWIKLRSQHSLTLPSQEMWELFRDMETAFTIHHGKEPDELSRATGVIRSFRRVLDTKFPHAPEALRATFARARTFMRMGRVNRWRRDESLAKRESRKRKARTT